VISSSAPWQSLDLSLPIQIPSLFRKGLFPPFSRKRGFFPSSPFPEEKESLSGRKEILARKGVHGGTPRTEKKGVVRTCFSQEEPRGLFFTTGFSFEKAALPT